MAETRSALATQAICFVHNGRTACVDRPALLSAATITEEVHALTRWLIAGPTSGEQARGVASPLPQGTRLDAVSVSGQRVAIALGCPMPPWPPCRPAVEDINEQFRTFTPYNFQRLEINARGSFGGYRLLSDSCRR
jgi:hypothetical protein